MLLACTVPAVWLFAKALAGMLGSKPLTYAIHDTGDWAVRFLLLSLLVTPLRTIANWPKLIMVRRMLGLTALAYVFIHLALYVVDQRYDLIKVASEIVQRFYLTIGFVALVGLAVLGATSTDAAIKRLGAVRWNKLHASVYVLTVLSLAHFFIQSRLDVTQPVLMSGFFVWLMGYRALRKRDVAINLGVLTALAIAAGLSTALVEVAWYASMTGVQASRVLAANLDFSFVIRPAWWVLAAGLGLALVNLATRSGSRISRDDALSTPPVLKQQ